MKAFRVSPTGTTVPVSEEDQLHPGRVMALTFCPECGELTRPVSGVERDEVVLLLDNVTVEITATVRGRRHLTDAELATVRGVLAKTVRGNAVQQRTARSTAKAASE